MSNRKLKSSPSIPTTITGTWGQFLGFSRFEEDRQFQLKGGIYENYDYCSVAFKGADVSITETV